MEKVKVEFEMRNPRVNHIMCKMCSSHFAPLKDIVEETGDFLAFQKVVNVRINGNQIFCLNCIRGPAIGYITPLQLFKFDKKFIMKKFQKVLVDAKTNSPMGLRCPLPNYYMCGHCQGHVALAAECEKVVKINGSYEGSFTIVVDVYATRIQQELHSEISGVFCDQCHARLGKVEKPLDHLERGALRNVTLNMDALLKKHGKLIFNSQGQWQVIGD